VELSHLKVCEKPGNCCSFEKFEPLGTKFPMRNSPKWVEDVLVSVISEKCCLVAIRNDGAIYKVFPVSNLDKQT